MGMVWSTRFISGDRMRLSRWKGVFRVTQVVVGWRPQTRQLAIFFHSVTRLYFNMSAFYKVEQKYTKLKNVSPVLSAIAPNVMPLRVTTVKHAMYLLCVYKHA